VYLARIMTTLAYVTAALLALAPSKKGKGNDEPADPNAAVAKEFGGKIWVTEAEAPAVEGDQLKSWLSGHAAASEIGRKSKDGPVHGRALARRRDRVRAGAAHDRRARRRGARRGRALRHGGGGSRRIAFQGVHDGQYGAW
jgi:hypothetical protein